MPRFKDLSLRVKVTLVTALVTGMALVLNCAAILAGTWWKFKETSVHLNVLSEVGESPLPRVNSRFGHPTPQQGVEVERKWKRPDYTAPGNGLVQLQTK